MSEKGKERRGRDNSKKEEDPEKRERVKDKAE